MFAGFAMVSAVSAVCAMSAVFRQSSANGDGDGENDRKEGFHGTKVFVAARSRAFTPVVVRIATSSSRKAVNNSSARTTKRFPSPRCAHQQSRLFAPESPTLTRSPNSNRLC
jgi:hypothetical protein